MGWNRNDQIRHNGDPPRYRRRFADPVYRNQAISAQLMRFRVVPDVPVFDLLSDCYYPKKVLTSLMVLFTLI